MCTLSVLVVRSVDLVMRPIVSVQESRLYLTIEVNILVDKLKLSLKNQLNKN